MLLSQRIRPKVVTYVTRISPEQARVFLVGPTHFARDFDTDIARSYHNSPTSQELLEILASRQNQSLQRLRMFELSPSLARNVILPNRLKAFDCCSVGDGKVVRDLIRMNRMTLQRLSLGQEKDLLLQYAQPGLGMLELASSSNILGPALLTGIPHLQELELTGLDISTLLPLSMDGIMPLCNLTKISLQSCSGADQFLGALGAVFASVQSAGPSPQQSVIHLKHFLLRTEAPTADLKRAIILFLASFRGLETLSLLFENGSVLERVSTLLGEHGPTLQTLCLEARIQPRDKLGLDTSRAFGSGGYSQELWERSMHEICQLCPNLVELGFSFPWDDELVRLRKTPLPTLAQLKTIHVRNFPENRALSQVGDYTIKEYAQKFVDWVFPTLGGGQRPPLEILAIGPSLYEGRMRILDTKPQLPEFKRTHFFGVDWAMTRFSKWSFMVSPVSERYLEETRDERPMKGVFEQVWLR